jgi:hypothetical protein
MLAAPVSRRMVITRLRRLAMMRGPLPVRTCERSSSKSLENGPSAGGLRCPSGRG